MPEFKDIKIVGIDEAASLSKPDPSTGLRTIVLVLSEPAPKEWADFFNERWTYTLYKPKRRARVLGPRLEISCLLDEFQQHHLEPLKQVIADSNEAYRKLFTKRQLEAQESAAREAAEHEKIRALKNIKFD